MLSGSYKLLAGREKLKIIANPDYLGLEGAVWFLHRLDKLRLYILTSKKKGSGAPILRFIEIVPWPTERKNYKAMRLHLVGVMERIAKEMREGKI